MNRPPLAITHCSLLTPLDSTRNGQPLDTWHALRAGQRVQGLRGAVSDHLLAGDPFWDRSIRLACTLADRLAPHLTSDGQTALFCATSKGPATTVLDALDALSRNRPLSEQTARQIALGVSALGAIIADRLHIPRVHTSVAACASGIFALHQAAGALWRGECTRALVLAADASLHPLFEASFARLGVLAPPDENDIRRCEPFSEEGRGFFLTEAAAALVLETASPRQKPLAFLESIWLGGDGTHLIAADQRAQSIHHGLREILPDSAPAFIHAHAPGTAHDAHELAAIRSVCGRGPAVFSSKAHLGHTLGAAGLVSVALSALCHQHRQTLTGVPIAPQSPSLTIAQGFGGHIGITRLRGA